MCLENIHNAIEELKKAKELCQIEHFYKRTISEALGKLIDLETEIISDLESR